MRLDPAKYPELPPGSQTNYNKKTQIHGQLPNCKG